MPHANSTMSMPRVTSPWASLKTLPCSAVIIAASVSRSRLSRLRKACMTRARRSGGVSAHAGCAAFAAATAASTSAGAASATRRATAPVAGLVTGWRAAARAGDAAAADEVADVGRAGEVFVGAHGRLSSVGRGVQRRRSIGVLGSSVSRTRNGSDGVLQQDGVGRVPHQQRDLVDDRAQRDRVARRPLASLRFLAAHHAVGPVVEDEGGVEHRDDVVGDEVALAHRLQHRVVHRVDAHVGAGIDERVEVVDVLAAVQASLRGVEDAVGGLRGEAEQGQLVADAVELPHADAGAAQARQDDVDHRRLRLGARRPLGVHLAEKLLQARRILGLRCHADKYPSTDRRRAGRRPAPLGYAARLSPRGPRC